MEEKKLDLNSIIGFVLIFLIMIFMFWQNRPSEEELAEQEKAKQEKVEAQKEEAQQTETVQTTSEDFSAASATDSLGLIALQNKLGAFAYASTLPSATDNETLIETDKFELKFSNKGGYLSEVKLKEFVDYNKRPIYLIEDGNARFNLSFTTRAHHLKKASNFK